MKAVEVRAWPGLVVQWSRFLFWLSADYQRCHPSGMMLLHFHCFPLGKSLSLLQPLLTRLQLANS